MLVLIMSREIDLPSDLLDSAKEDKFEVKGYTFDSVREESRQPHIVRVGLIQNSIVLPTDAPVPQQVSHQAAYVIFKSSCVFISNYNVLPVLCT